MLFVSDVSRTAINSLLQRYGIFFEQQDRDCSISGSFWGDSEAGIIGNTVYARRDTPVHSLLHETCHVICMTADRRIGLDSDAGGDDIEECAVCYLQLVLADHIDGVGQDQLMLDMDAWGYSFRRGSARDWFQSDAEDAVEFLMNHRLLDSSGAPTFQLRQ